MIENNIPTKEMSYIGSFIYDENINKAYVLFDEGRLMDDEGDYTYEYFLKDHLGNTRVSFTKNGSIQKLQEDHYYPFGMTFQGVSNTFTSPENKYKYNGKELQDDGFDLNNDGIVDRKLDLYDYGWRMYDAALGRFHVIDRFAEKYMSMTPYQYAANNPILFLDINGDSIYVSGDQAKRFTKSLNKGTSLKLKYDKKSGAITAKGKAKTDSDKTLLEAINSGDVNVNIATTSKNTTEDGSWFVIGAFGGSEAVDGKTETTQTVNMDHVDAAAELYGNDGSGYTLHETIESYIGGKDSPGSGSPSFDQSTQEFKNYQSAHNKTMALDPSYQAPSISVGVVKQTSTSATLDVYIENFKVIQGIKFGGEKKLYRTTVKTK